MDQWSRRRFLKATGGLVAGGAAFGALSGSARAALATVAKAGCGLSDIEHVVILLQENRAFDHYFGSLSGVRGFDDPDVQRDPLTGRSVFEQLNPLGPLLGSGPTLMPFRLDPKTSAAQCLLDVDHTWQTQHLSIDGGRNDLWLAAHLPTDAVSDVLAKDPFEIAKGGYRVMSYFTRDDLPFHYALADAFTICDHYFCSVIGPTNPNRLMMMTGTIDPDGTHGGPDVNNLKTSGLSWTTYADQLQAAGIDWYLYAEADDYQERELDHFVQFQDPSTDKYRRARSIIPAGQLAVKLRHDVEAGNLPQVSWIVGPEATTEHPNHMPAQGANFVQGVLEALTADAKVWSKTVLIVTYDENGGFFDHVTPPMAPPGTPGEYLTANGLLRAPEGTLMAGPIGLGPRVPALIISPFSRGGYVCSDTFDHTSILRFLEARFGVEAPNISAWRRETCGDLTSAFNFGRGVDTTMPDLPDTGPLLEEARQECAKLPTPPVPREQVMPKQEPGTRPRVGAACPAATPPATPQAPSDPSTREREGASAPHPAGRERITLAATGGRDLAPLAGVAAATALGLRLLARRNEVGDERSSE